MFSLLSSALTLSARHAGLLDYIKSYPGGEIGPVRPAVSAIGAGAGCFATRDVEANELLFAVPASACVGTESTAVEYATVAANARERVALYLANAHLSGDSGKASPYLGTLPWTAEDQEHVLWWSEDELLLLAGCTAHERASDLHAHVRAAVLKLQPSGAAADEAVDAAVRGAFVSIFSRAFSYGETWLVPMLDILNHQSSSNVFHYEETLDDAVADADGEGAATTPTRRIVVRAKEPIAEGAEVINLYGEGADCDFGCDYGFFDSGGLADDPTSWSAEAMRRRSACSTEVEVGGLRFTVSLRQIDYLRLAEVISLAAAASRADLVDLVACAELVALADGGESGAAGVMLDSATRRATEMAEGRCVADAVIASAAATGGISPDRVALSAKLRRSEEIALDALTSALERCRR